MKINRVFLDVHMGLAFQGLNEIAKKAQTKLDADSVVIFMNKKATSFKLMVAGAYLTYYKNGNKQIPLEALRYLPRAFGGSQMQFDQAVRSMLWEKLQLKENGKQ